MCVVCLLCVICVVWFGVTVMYGVFDVFGVSSVFDVWCELWTLPATGQQSQLHCTTGGILNVQRSKPGLESCTKLYTPALFSAPFKMALYLRFASYKLALFFNPTKLH